MGQKTNFHWFYCTTVKVAINLRMLQKFKITAKITEHSAKTFADIVVTKHAEICCSIDTKLSKGSLSTPA